MFRFHLILLFSLVLLSEFKVFANEFELIPGQHEIGMRTRYQAIDDAWLGNAKAFTTRINLTSTFLLDDKQQWEFQIQPNYVFAFNNGDFNSITIQKNTSPIPDPQGFNLSKIYLAYDSDKNWQLKLGRQNLTFNNERFIGGQDFWQTPQTFDAFKFDFNDQMNWHVQYAYSNKVHRIFGRDSTLEIPKDDIRYNVGTIAHRSLNELGVHSMNAHFLNIEFKTDDNLSFIAYDYLVENKTQSLFSTQTFGVRISDEFKPGKFKYRYTAEHALQQDQYNNPRDYQAWYSLLQGSIQYKSHLFELSQEVFSEQGDGDVFITPLGTNHKFQGWADVFTGYGINTGLRDQYFTYKGRAKKIRWRVVYHHFKDYVTGVTIGNEFGIELGYRATRKWEFKLVYASYKTKNGLDSFPRTKHDITSLFASVAYNL